MNSILSSARRSIVTGALALAGLGLFSSSSEAARITFFVKVPGYSTAGWIQVIPGSNTGGRVIYSASHGGYITDRVSRGETFCDVIEPSTTAESNATGTCAYRVYSDRGTLQSAQIRLPFSKTFAISTNPADDNIHVSVQTPSGTFAKRIPIGSR